MSLLSCAWASNAELRCICTIQHTVYGLTVVKIECAFHTSTDIIHPDIFRSFQLTDSNVSDSNSTLILVRKQKEFISSIRHCIISFRFASDMLTVSNSMPFSTIFFIPIQFLWLHGKERIASRESLERKINLFIHFENKTEQFFKVIDFVSTWCVRVPCTVHIPAQLNLLKLNFKRNVNCTMHKLIANK